MRDLLLDLSQPFRDLAFWLRRPDIAWMLHRCRQAARVRQVIVAA